MADVNKTQGDILATELGDAVIFVQSDVTDYDSQVQIFEQVWSKWQRIDFGSSPPLLMVLMKLTLTDSSCCKCRDSRQLLALRTGCRRDTAS